MKKPEFHFPPIFKKLKRGGPAIVLPKDIGMIIAYTGINRESKVIEAGSGSGFLTVALAQVAKEVISYEISSEFAKFAEDNIKRAGLDNAIVKNKDVLAGIDEEEVDAVVLDMKDAAKAVHIAHRSIKKDGALVGYLPNIEQAKEFHLECEKVFGKAFMLESIVREYEVRDFGVRPRHFGLMHTAYIIFARK